MKNTGLKATLQTTSGQEVAIYQYNLRAGAAIVHTIKGVRLGLRRAGAAPTARLLASLAPQAGRPQQPRVMPACQTRL